MLSKHQGAKEKKVQDDINYKRYDLIAWGIDLSFFCPTVSQVNQSRETWSVLKSSSTNKYREKEMVVYES